MRVVLVATTFSAAGTLLGTAPAPEREAFAKRRTNPSLPYRRRVRQATVAARAHQRHFQQDAPAAGR